MSDGLVTLEACPSCGSARIVRYSFTPEQERRDSVHYAQSHCRDCDIVFSNPVATVEQLRRLYEDSYYEEKEECFKAKGKDLEAQVLQRARQEEAAIRGIVLPYKKRGVFFEIGAGYGPLLKAAERAGFTAKGIEASKSAVEFGRNTLKLEGLEHGMFDARHYPERYCDFIFSFQVIEHILNLREFLKGTYRMLKPGGCMFVGTENHRNWLVPYRRMRCRLKGRPLPEFQTANHHTYYFSDKSLKRLLKANGFEILKTRVYSVPLTVIRSSRLRRLLSLSIARALYLADVLTFSGNRVLVWCRRPE